MIQAILSSQSTHTAQRSSEQDGAPPLSLFGYTAFPLFHCIADNSSRARLFRPSNFQTIYVLFVASVSAQCVIVLHNTPHRIVLVLPIPPSCFPLTLQ